MNSIADTPFELRYRSLFDPGRGFAFPCNARGQVDLAHLSDRARNNYLYARAMVGKELAPPSVEHCGPHWEHDATAPGAVTRFSDPDSRSP